MGRGRVLLVAASLTFVCAVPAGAATPRVVSLPWPPSILPHVPPLTPASPGLVPLNPRFLRRLTNTERVVVGVDAEGEPQSVNVVHRIAVRALGDYVFTIPAPVRSVLPGPGTQSPPGQRENQIIWEGFSPGHRVLAAQAELRPADSVDALPVRVHVETTVDGRPLAQGETRSGPLRVVLTIMNATAVTARSYTAKPDPADLALVLGRIRAAIRQNVFAEGLNVRLRSRRAPVRTRVAAPLRLQGTLRFAPGTARLAGARNGVVDFAGSLDGLRHTQLRLELRGQATNAGPPKLGLRVRPQAVPDTVRPGQSARERLGRTVALELGYARKRQYDQFLASPDPTGPSSTIYVYRTTAPAPPAAESSSGGGSDGNLGWIVVGLALVAGLPAAAVVWARS